MGLIEMFGIIFGFYPQISTDLDTDFHRFLVHKWHKWFTQMSANNLYLLNRPSSC